MYLQLTRASPDDLYVSSTISRPVKLSSYQRCGQELDLDHVISSFRRSWVHVLD